MGKSEIDSNHDLPRKSGLGTTQQVGQIDATGPNSTGHDWVAAECQQLIAQKREDAPNSTLPHWRRPHHHLLTTNPNIRTNHLSSECREQQCRYSRQDLNADSGCAAQRDEMRRFRSRSAGKSFAQLYSRYTTSKEIHTVMSLAETPGLQTVKN
jgi:hypothetical protein